MDNMSPENKFKTVLRKVPYITPSLVIGLGGVGKQVLTHLKRRLYDDFLADLEGEDVIHLKNSKKIPSLRLFCIDSDAKEKLIISSHIDGSPIQLDNEELMIMDMSEVPGRVTNLDNFDDLKGWYPGERGSVSVQQVIAGAGQVRAIGRAGFFINYNRILTRLRQAWEPLTQPVVTQESQKIFKTDPNQSLFSHKRYIYVINSVCGGTGAGTFLDVIYNMHNIVGNLHGVQYIGIIILPEVFEGLVDQREIPRLRSNAYGALKEIDTFMTGHENFTAPYSIGTLDMTRRPYDYLFLISNKNSSGYTMNHKSLYRMIAEGIIIDSYSKVSQRSESIFTNIYDAVNRPFIRGGKPYLPCYSSFGIASLHINALEKSDIFLKFHIKDKLMDIITRVYTENETVHESAIKYCQTIKFGTVETTVGDFGDFEDISDYKNWSGKIIENVPEAEKMRDEINEWLKKMSGLDIEADKPGLKNFENIIDNPNIPDSEAMVMEKARNIISAFSINLEKEVDNASKDIKTGYYYINSWLKAIKEFLLSQASSLKEPERLLDYVNELKKWDNYLKKAINSSLPDWRRIVRDAFTQYLVPLKIFYKKFLGPLRREAIIIDIYRKLIEICDEKIASLKILINNLEEIEEDIYKGQIEAMRLIEGRIIIADYVDRDMTTCGDNINKYIKIRLAELELNDFNGIAEDFINRYSYDSLILENKEEIKIYIYDFIDNLLDRALKDVKSLPQKESKILNYIADLANILPYSLPYWSIDTTSLKPPESGVKCAIGVDIENTDVPPEVTSKIMSVAGFANMEQDSIVSMGSEYSQFIIKQYEYGYPLACLANIKDYYNSYLNFKDDKLSPPHINVWYKKFQNPESADSDIPRCPKCNHDITRQLAKKEEYCARCGCFIKPGKKLCPKNHECDADDVKCLHPGCGHIFIDLKMFKCPGERGKCELHIKEKSKVGNLCRKCGSLWEDFCPYCKKNPHIIIKVNGKFACSKEGGVNQPVVACYHCGCPVKPERQICPRCHRDIRECKTCSTEGTSEYLYDTKLIICPVCRKKIDEEALCEEPEKAKNPCENCGYELKENWKSCPACGNPVEKEGKISCPKCREFIPNDSEICPECRVKVKQVEVFKCPNLKCNKEFKKDDVKDFKFCPDCNSKWADICPYCNSSLYKCKNGSLACTKESCDGKIIVSCCECGSPMKDNDTKCPRCFTDVQECKACANNNSQKRMFPVTLNDCPVCKTPAIALAGNP